MELRGGRVEPPARTAVGGRNEASRLCTAFFFHVFCLRHRRHATHLQPLLALRLHFHTHVAATVAPASTRQLNIHSTSRYRLKSCSCCDAPGPSGPLPGPPHSRFLCTTLPDRRASTSAAMMGCEGSKGTCFAQSLPFVTMELTEPPAQNQFTHPERAVKLPPDLLLADEPLVVLSHQPEHVPARAQRV